MQIKAVLGWCLRLDKAVSQRPAPILARKLGILRDMWPWEEHIPKLLLGTRHCRVGTECVLQSMLLTL